MIINRATVTQACLMSKPLYVMIVIKNNNLKHEVLSWSLAMKFWSKRKQFVHFPFFLQASNQR